MRIRAISLLGVLLLWAPAVSAQKKDARRIYEEATSAFGLARYAEAAEKYEQAFALRPDPALLYNAAQSYRLAGNKARALELYRNCLRLYPTFANAEDARNHVASLKKQLDDERAAGAAPPPVAPAPPARTPATTSPPAAMPPPVVTPVPAPPAALPPPPAPAPAPAPAAPPPAMPAPVLTQPPPPAPAAAPLVGDSTLPTVSQTASTPGEDKPITSQTWFWVAVGAVVVVAGTVAIVLATRGDKYPDASFGKAPGN